MAKKWLDSPTRANTLIDGSEERRKVDILVRERANLEPRKNFFTVRVETLWNQLPEEVRTQRTVNSFKNAYDRWRIRNNNQTKGD